MKIFDRMLNTDHFPLMYFFIQYLYFNDIFVAKVLTLIISANRNYMVSVVLLLSL